jgi:hypothetical protein
MVPIKTLEVVTQEVRLVKKCNIQIHVTKYRALHNVLRDYKHL